MSKFKDKGILTLALIVAGGIILFGAKSTRSADILPSEPYVISPLPELNLASDVFEQAKVFEAQAREQDIAKTQAISAGLVQPAIDAAALVSPLEVMNTFEYYARNLPASPAAARALAAASPAVLTAIYSPVTPGEAYVQSLSIPQAQAAYKQVQIAQESVKALSGGDTAALRRLLVGY